MQSIARMGVALLSVSVMLGGCDKVVDTSKAVQTVTRAAFEDTKSSWRDFFTYHPAQPDPLPQTRYCYQMQSDVVCYDSEQTLLTSKLVGYQDGDSISWVQPGGGSLGASGGEAVALRPRVDRFGTPASTAAVPPQGAMIDTGPVPLGGSNPTGGTVASTAGQINVVTLPKKAN